MYVSVGSLITLAFSSLSYYYYYNEEESINLTSLGQSHEHTNSELRGLDFADSCCVR